MCAGRGRGEECDTPHRPRWRRSPSPYPHHTGGRNQFLLPFYSLSFIVCHSADGRGGSKLASPRQEVIHQPMPSHRPPLNAIAGPRSQISGRGEFSHPLASCGYQPAMVVADLQSALRGMFSHPLASCGYQPAMVVADLQSALRGMFSHPLASCGYQPIPSRHTPRCLVDHQCTSHALRCRSVFGQVDQSSNATRS